MKKDILVKAGAGFVALIVILNIIFFAMRKINARIFWIIIALAALFAYIVLPRLREQIK
jgi:hypothetical protein